MEVISEGRQPSHPFNSTLETGIRAVMLLEAFYPRQCDLIEMTWLDHLVVHTADLDGEDVPPSLHPDLPNRTGELFVRRQLVEKSLRIMQQVHLVDVVETDLGVTFVASEDAPTYLDLLQSDYSMALKERARWIAQRFAGMATVEIKAVIEAKIGRWTAEFRADHAPTGSSA
ncbi:MULTISPECIES: ABC-three component system middle component 2 [unclassified Mesorhizobium]|uniref:ABC-three component system middle component 2 n=1 Tax=unclassified Mesorhizobium TaxID=325217 RepID=UPI001FE15C47|nr:MULTISPECIES: ABC-three component system middle component 2 [unclassified Mesorhizobium]